MNARMILAFAVTAAMAISALADHGAAGPVRRKGGKATGGFLEVANKGKVLQLVNLGGCESDEFAAVVKIVEGTFGFPLVTTATATSGTRDAKSVARVTIVSKDNVPALLCAPDEGWAEVNVKPLLGDDPTDFAFRQRLQKETLRAFGYALGCGNSAARPCLMMDAETLQQLDALPKTYGPEANSKTAFTARQRGAVARKFVSYRVACQEGWAPAPTNDVQKAIWTEVHEIPTEPLKIKFDPKTDTK